MARAFRLCTKNLPKLRPEIRCLPTIDRSKVSNGIVHLGVGGFHRSHQAIYTAAALAGDPSWGICGVGLVPSDRALHEKLAAQDYMYTVAAKSSGSTDVSVIGSITDLILAVDTPSRQRLMQTLCGEETKIVSLTVTEKAYMVDDSSGRLDVGAPLIQKDLQSKADGGLPCTAVGVIAQGLLARLDRGLPPFTVLSCDNLPMNGNLLRALVLDFAEAAGDDTLARLVSEAAFPNTMVDRITPYTHPEHLDEVATTYGIVDECPVLCEDFTQWVVEDDFPLGRPQWDAHGAMFVADVKPYELMKLRLLNGGHSALAYLSYLKGHRTVDGAMADEQVCGFVRAYMAQVQPSVPDVPGVDLAEYQQTLIRRFSNENISDQVSRLCEDGSKKMIAFVRDALHELLRNGHPTGCVAAAVAGWIRYCRGYDLDSAPIDVQDPAAKALEDGARGVAADGHNPAQFLATFLSPDIAANRNFVAQVRGHLRELDADDRTSNVLDTRK